MSFSLVLTFIVDIFFILTLPVKSFKRKVCSSGLKIDKAPLLLYILLAILLVLFFFLLSKMNTYFYFHNSFYQFHYLHATCTCFSIPWENLSENLICYLPCCSVTLKPISVTFIPGCSKQKKLQEIIAHCSCACCLQC